MAQRKGSWLWALRMAETTAWGSAGLFLLWLAASPAPAGVRLRGVVLLIALAAWIAATFRVVLPARADDVVTAVATVVVATAFAAGAWWIAGSYQPAVRLLFVPVALCAGLLGGYYVGGGAALLGAAAYTVLAIHLGVWHGPGQTIVVAGVLLLVGLVSGGLSLQLRAHLRGEEEEHRIAVAVRHRLVAVLDAVDEAIVFSDRQGTVRLVNRRAAELFDISPDDHVGRPHVQLLRLLARRTEDPEGFMETFQEVRDDPEAELRTLVEQIIPQRRQMRLFSGPARDEAGEVVGRIDVYTDISEAMARSREVRRLLEEARLVAESYQRSLLPTAIPSLPRVSLVAHYIPAAGRRAVCGDFYDFVGLPDGRMAMVLGDVVGAGPAAANDAALTRYTLRSFASEVSSPERLMQWMNRYLASELSTERFVRLLLVSLDPERAVLDYVNAGHVPPVLFRFRSGEAEFLGEGGLALGVEDDSTYKAASVALEPGDTLVLYTDGVTEAPRRGRPFGQGRLLDLVSEYGVGTPGEVVQAVRRSVELWVEDEELRDDLALIVCQVVPDALIGEPIRELVLPNDPARLQEMRSFVASFLADVRAPVGPSSELLLAVGEATANATRHGRRTDRSEVRIRCAVEGAEAVVTVADDGAGFQPSAEDMAAPQDRFASGGRGLFLMQQLADDVAITGSEAGTTVTLRKRLWNEPAASR